MARRRRKKVRSVVPVTPTEVVTTRKKRSRRVTAQEFADVTGRAYSAGRDFADSVFDLINLFG